MFSKERREAFASLSKRLKKSSKSFIRPPYGVSEDLFHKCCLDCEKKQCVGICEEDIIKLDERGVPYLYFKESGCTFCKECARVCPTDALSLENKESIVAKFSINVRRCYAWNGTMCFSCKDACIYDAIEFFGVFRPKIDSSKCVSCGFCYGVCPASAVDILHS